MLSCLTTEPALYLFPLFLHLHFFFLSLCTSSSLSLIYEPWSSRHCNSIGHIAGELTLANHSAPSSLKWSPVRLYAVEAGKWASSQLGHSFCSLDNTRQEQPRKGAQRVCVSADIELLTFFPSSLPLFVG